MKHILLFLLTFLAPALWAQQPEQFKLWPDNPEAAEAEIFVYHPAKSNQPSPGILICPGGGYQGLSMDNEGHTMARWYSSRGFLAVVLKYRMPKGVHTIPLSDAEKAMETIRDNAGKWNVDTKRIGVVGSSAGGHLAASLSTLAADANRPAFAILYYPVISFDKMVTHGGSKKNLLGEEIDNQTLLDRYSLQKQVDDKTPRTLLLLSDDDKVVPQANSILYYTALNEKQIPASMYIFPDGGHGWGTQPWFTYKEEVKDLIWKWLQYTKIVE